MAIRRILGTALFATVMFGCGINDNSYDFKGKIDGEKITFTKERDSGCLWDTEDDVNYLTVTRKDGRVIVYIDRRNNRTVDEVKIDGESYTNNAAGKPVIEKAQKQFYAYLNKILEYKRAKGLKGLE